MDRVPSNGLTAQYILVLLFKTTSKGKDFIHGLMDANIKVNGSRIRCMAMEYLRGLMVVGTKAVTFTTRNKEMEHLNGKFIIVIIM
jgi:hypothetical protein